MNKKSTFPIEKPSSSKREELSQNKNEESSSDAQEAQQRLSEMLTNLSSTDNSQPSSSSPFNNESISPLQKYLSTAKAPASIVNTLTNAAMSPTDYSAENTFSFGNNNQQESSNRFVFDRTEPLNDTIVSSPAAVSDRKMSAESVAEKSAKKLIIQQQTQISQIVPVELALASEKRNIDFHLLFRSVPARDPLIEDYSCALQRDIVIHGRLYLSKENLCFNSNIFGWVTNLIIGFSEVTAIERRMTAFVIPNAIQITTLKSKFLFLSFLYREEAFSALIKLWRYARGDNVDGLPFTHETDLSSVLSPLPQDVYDSLNTTRSVPGFAVSNMEMSPVSQVNLRRVSMHAGGSLSDSGLGDNSVLSSSSLSRNKKKSLSSKHGLLKKFVSKMKKNRSRMEPVLDGSAEAESNGNYTDSDYSIRSDDGRLFSSTGYSSEQSDTFEFERAPRPRTKLSELFRVEMEADGAENSDTERDQYERNHRESHSDTEGVAMTSSKQRRRKSSRHYSRKSSLKNNNHSSAAAPLKMIVNIPQKIPKLPVYCNCIDHCKIPVIDHVFPVSIATLVSVIFGSTEFLELVFKARNFESVSIGKWDKSSGAEKREMEYSVPVRFPFAPRVTRCFLTQRYTRKDANRVFCVREQTTIPGVPGGSSFKSLASICIMRVSDHETRLRVSFELEFTRTLWIRGILEKNSIDGNLAYWQAFETIALQKCAMLALSPQQGVSPATDDAHSSPSSTASLGYNASPRSLPIEKSSSSWVGIVFEWVEWVRVGTLLYLQMHMSKLIPIACILLFIWNIQTWIYSSAITDRMSELFELRIERMDPVVNEHVLVKWWTEFPYTPSQLFELEQIKDNSEIFDSIDTLRVDELYRDIVREMEQVWMAANEETTILTKLIEKNMK